MVNPPDAALIRAIIKRLESKRCKELYEDARKAETTDPRRAERLYQAAAKKRYPDAWRQLGSLYTTLNRRGDALEAYKRYLKLSPSAGDAEAVKEVIVRLGGRP